MRVEESSRLRGSFVDHALDLRACMTESLCQQVRHIVGQLALCPAALQLGSHHPPGQCHAGDSTAARLECVAAHEKRQAAVGVILHLPEQEAANRMADPEEAL